MRTGVYRGRQEVWLVGKRQKRTNSREKVVLLVLRRQARGAADDGHRGFCSVELPVLSRALLPRERQHARLDRGPSAKREAV